MRREMERMGERIAKVEDRVRKVKEEMAEMETQVGKALALVPRIKELSGRLELHWKAQAEGNALVMAELSDLRHAVAPAIESELKRHDLKLQDLSTKYSQIYAFATALLYASYPATHANGFKSTYPGYLTPMTTPDCKMISTF